MVSTPDVPGPSMDAVPTRYGDTTFRSRLEADWAATLDGNGIRWEYEPETLTLDSGTLYLPDFWLPELGTWIEVKGPGIPRTEKAEELARTRTCRCEGSCTCRWPGGEFVLLGKPSLASDWNEPGHRPRSGYANWATPFGPTAYFVTCPRAHGRSGSPSGAPGAAGERTGPPACRPVRPLRRDRHRHGPLRDARPGRALHRRGTRPDRRPLGR